jgi:hypothetical protein
MQSINLLYRRDMMKSQPNKKRVTKKTSIRKNSSALSKEWELLSKRLALVIADLEEDEYLIISEKVRKIYVQFSAQGYYGMRMEAIGNEFLDPADRLAKDAQQTMRSMGWRLPTYKKAKVDSEPPVGSCNYYIDADKPVSFAQLAAVAVQSLQHVYCTRHPGVLQYKAFGPDGYSIRFPTLGLKKEVTSDAIQNTKEPLKGYNEFISGLSREQIENLSNEDILELAIERPNHPGQFGFLLKLEYFRSEEHLAETMKVLLERLAKAKNDIPPSKGTKSH